MWTFFQLSFLNLWSLRVPLCNHTVHLFSIDCSASCRELHPEFHPLHCGYLRAFGLSFYFTKTLASGKQSITERQQEQAGAEYEQNTLRSP